ncbi:DUF397 domain-containing protein [Streptomyces phaeochromogenes]|uniref:DUF397 domain-containing protein n=1 Tax=Streptomyces phaeochromogenes TaxID=1923 RepID=UPI00368258B2
MTRCQWRETQVSTWIDLSGGFVAEQTWFSGSASVGGQACVEVMVAPDGIRVRDSKDTTRTCLRISAACWIHFRHAIADGKL